MREGFCRRVDNVHLSTLLSTPLDIRIGNEGSTMNNRDIAKAIVQITRALTSRGAPMSFKALPPRRTPDIKIAALHVLERQGVIQSTADARYALTTQWCGFWPTTRLVLPWVQELSDER